MVEAAGAPLALFGRNLPVAALIPLTILWFGIDETQKVMFIFIACVPFVYSDAVAAIASVPDRYVETAQTLGATSLQIVRKVLVALALPDIYNSLRHLFGLAFGYIMLAELINAQHGLGYLLMTSQRRGLSEHIILILIIIGLLAYGIDRAAVLVPARPVSVPRRRGLMVSDRAAAAGRAAERRRLSRRHEAVRRRHRHPRRDLLGAGPAGQGRVHLDPRAVRLRQVDRAAADRRAARRSIRPPKAPCSSAASRSSRPGPDRSMVFQDYTSFDNRTVEDNVAFGLECRGVPARERRERAREWIAQGRPRREARRDEVSRASCRAACGSASRSRAR